MSENQTSVEQRVVDFGTRFAAVKAEIGKVIVGNEPIVDGVLTGLFADGHILLEGVPGLGKTLLVKTLADAVNLRFSRIQFTPDLMPADISGTNILAETSTGAREFRFQPGPVFANVVLADEINRATPKTQSAMLEAMQEHSVTVAGRRHALEEPFFVLATQNPIEMEGTYPLPEAQLDRFLLKVLVPTPGPEDLTAILDRTTGVEAADVRHAIDASGILEMRRLVREVKIAGPVKDYAVRLILATHPDRPEAPETIRRYVRFGSSPRGAQAVVLAAKVMALLDQRLNVAFSDLEAAAPSALRHRVLMNYEGEADGKSTDSLVSDVLASVKESERSKSGI